MSRIDPMFCSKSHMAYTCPLYVTLCLLYSPLLCLSAQLCQEKRLNFLENSELSRNPICTRSPHSCSEMPSIVNKTLEVFMKYLKVFGTD